MQKSKLPTFHIVWTTFGTWPVHDARGNWQALGELYTRINSPQERLHFVKALPTQWTAQSQQTPLVFDSKQREMVYHHITDLILNDRIARQLELIELLVLPQSVQLICRCVQNLLSQSVGRIKSRSATLLNFETEGIIGGSHTWTKGFWQVELMDETAIKMVVNFFEQWV